MSETAIRSLGYEWIRGDQMSPEQREFWDSIGSDFTDAGMPERTLEGLLCFIGNDAVIQVIDHDDKDISWIQTIYVRPMMRRCGFASHLILESVSRACEKSYRVGLGTRVGNVAMQSLAAKLGFTEGIVYNEGKTIAYWRTPGLIGVE